MAIGVLHIDDVMLSVMVDGQSEPVYAEPAFAWFQPDASIVTGHKAYAAERLHPRSVKNRYLHALSTRPLKDQRFNQLSSADLLAEQIEHAVGRAQGVIDELIVAVPGNYGANELGVLLGIANALSLPVKGLVDSSVSASTKTYPDCQLFFLDVSLHSSVISALDQDDLIRLRRHQPVPEVGIDSLRNAWLGRVATAFVDQSRFDPLHSAEAEQALVDRLPEWLNAARSAEQIALQLSFDGRDYAATIDTLDFISVVSAQYQQLADQLRAMYSAGTPAVVQVVKRTAELPGLLDYLRARTEVDFAILDDQAVSLGALARNSVAIEHGIESLLTALPATGVRQAATAKPSATSNSYPTHILSKATAHPLTSEPLVIGAGGGHDARRLSVAADTAGVSKLHCAIHVEGGQCVVSDHSRYGTFLNSNKINGSAVLQVGDTLRVGTPGAEFTLIKVAE